MLLHDLIQTTPRTEIGAAVLASYPQMAEGLLAVFDQLLHIGPVADDDDRELRMARFTYPGGEPGISCGVFFPADNQTFDFTLNPWCEWLACDVPAHTLAALARGELLARVLYEMSFFGFTQEDREAKWQRMQAAGEQHPN